MFALVIGWGSTRYRTIRFAVRQASFKARVQTCPQLMRSEGVGLEERAYGLGYTRARSLAHSM